MEKEKKDKGCCLKAAVRRAVAGLAGIKGAGIVPFRQIFQICKNLEAALDEVESDCAKDDG